MTAAQIKRLETIIGKLEALQHARPLAPDIADRLHEAKTSLLAALRHAENGRTA